MLKLLFNSTEDDPFTWMAHSLEWPIQLKMVLSTSFFFLNISNLTWNFILNRFQSAQTSSSMLELLFNSTEDDPFTWMVHSLEWPIQLKMVLSTSFFFLKYIKSNLKFHLLFNFDPFTRGPFTEWPIQLKIVLSTLFFFKYSPMKFHFKMVHLSEGWPIHLNGPFTGEWPIQLKIVLSTSFFLFKYSNEWKFHA